MRILKSYIILLVFLLSCICCIAREKWQYNINFNTGLPSNQAYNIKVDRLGYLWIATDKGVARYNGYGLKVFDLSKGFINKDIWALHEDRKGRMWLMSISDVIGYIYNDKYYKVYNKQKGTTYPRLPIDYDDGICFVGTVISNINEPGGHVYYFVEKNDTLTAHGITRHPEINFPIDNQNLVSIGVDSVIYSVNISGSGVQTYSALKKLKVLSHRTQNIGVITELQSKLHGKFGRFVFSYGNGSDCLGIFDLSAGTYEDVDFKRLSRRAEEEHVKLVYDVVDTLILFTEKRIYKFDTNLQVINSVCIDSLISRSESESISYYVTHGLWGTILSTYENGVYVTGSMDSSIRKVSNIALSNFSFCGNSSDTVGYWWNEQKQELVKLGRDLNTQRRKLDISGYVKIIPYNNRYALLLCAKYIYLLDIAALTIKEFGGVSVLDAVVDGDDELYFISKFRGLYYQNFKNGSAETHIDKERYKAIVYDSFRQAYWAYNHRKIFIYKKDSAPRVFTREELEARSINNIVNILIDRKYGNIIICEEKRILLFRDFNKPYQVLFGTSVLDNSKAVLQNNNLVIAGAFGVLFSKVLGPGKVSEPIVYSNTRKLRYNFVTDLQLLGSKAVINTDKGVYTADIPVDGLFSNAESYELQASASVLIYSGNSFLLKGNDTISVSQDAPRLQFDLIKPTGSGRVRYRYSLGGADNQWYELANNELSLPVLAAGKYYKLSLRAYDDQWISTARVIYLYITPYWWQEPLGKQVIWAVSISVLLVFVYVVMAITRRHVEKKTAKKNQQLELELKSIYAQLNPHFIFNSLSAALYLVKTKRIEDAYEHIYKFSHLVRSYIKSSRNRYLYLKEEIINLRNYIELQQVRFRGKFEYELFVGDNVDTDVKIPALLLQPIVENAIDHGLLQKEANGLIKISFEKKEHNNELWCIIDDNGIGRLKSGLIQKDLSLKGESYGNSLIKDLSDIFNKYEQIKIEIDYFDKVEPLTGTTVTVKIKFP